MQQIAYKFSVKSRYMVRGSVNRTNRAIRSSNKKTNLEALLAIPMNIQRVNFRIFTEFDK